MPNAAHSIDTPRLNRPTRRASTRRPMLETPARHPESSFDSQERDSLPPVLGGPRSARSKDVGQASIAAVQRLSRPLDPIEEKAGYERLSAPVAYERDYVDICGGLKGAVWMGQAEGRSIASADKDGWFYFDPAECKAACGLSLKEFATCRAFNQAKGFIESRSAGRRVQFRLNKRAMDRALYERARQLLAEEEQARGAGATRTA